MDSKIMMDKEIIEAWGETYRLLSDGAEFHMIYDEGIENYRMLIHNTMNFISRQKSELAEQQRRITEFKNTCNCQKSEIANYSNNNKGLTDSIMRLQNEVKMLKKENAELNNANMMLVSMFENVKADTVREFHELFESKMNEVDIPCSIIVKKMVTVCKRIMDETKNEMVGEG